MAKPSPNAPQMLLRGIACIVIGAAVLLAPMFVQAPGTREMIRGAYLVGWFSIVLGAALVGVELLQRARRNRS